MDYSKLFNSVLTEDQESKFKSWVQEQSQKSGRDIAGDLKNYDLRGHAVLNNFQPVKKFAYDEAFKKPNNPEFSVNSIYAGQSMPQPPSAGKQMMNVVSNAMKDQVMRQMPYEKSGLTGPSAWAAESGGQVPGHYTKEVLKGMASNVIGGMPQAVGRSLLNSLPSVKTPAGDVRLDLNRGGPMVTLRKSF